MCKVAEFRLPSNIVAMFFPQIFFFKDGVDEYQIMGSEYMYSLFLRMYSALSYLVSMWTPSIILDCALKPAPVGAGPWLRFTLRHVPGDDNDIGLGWNRNRLLKRPYRLMSLPQATRYSWIRQVCIRLWVAYFTVNDRNLAKAKVNNTDIFC